MALDAILASMRGVQPRVVPEVKDVQPNLRQKIESIIGTKVRDIALYIEACTHKSAEAQCGYSQERLEHLGDAILGAAVTKILFDHYRYIDEGSLSRLRTKIVNGTMLAQIGRQLCLNEVIVLGNVATAALSHDKIYEDTFEAVVGAVFMDLGFEEAVAFVRRVIRNCIDADTIRHDDNYRDVLRRYLGRNHMRPADYQTVQMENREFHCTVTVYAHTGIVSAEANASHKRKAEMEAARSVLIALGYDVEAETII